MARRPHHDIAQSGCPYIHGVSSGVYQRASWYFVIEACVLYDAYKYILYNTYSQYLDATNEWASVVCRKGQVVQSLFLPFPLSVNPWREDPTIEKTQEPTIEKTPP